MISRGPGTCNDVSEKGGDMARQGWRGVTLLLIWLLGLTGWAGTIPSSTASNAPPASDGPEPSVSPLQSPEKTVTVRPREIDDILYNPGMGFTDFHFGFGHPPPVEAYPHATVAYFRWPWAE